MDAMTFRATPYRAPTWLPGGHLQTIYPATLLKQAPVHFRREVWETPDHDQIALDWVDGPPSAPLVVMFHGLEGSSASHYCQSLMRAVKELGWRGAIPHFRGCGGIENRLHRAYHAGDADEIRWICLRLRALAPSSPLFVAGVSLGGSALANWLGRYPEEASCTVTAGAVISSPLNLPAAGKVLDKGLNKAIYTREFLRTLRPKSLGKLQGHFSDAALKAIQRSTTFREFDDLVTAPLHGYSGVDDYWTRASALPWLRAIQAPTLIINARNDPFMPAHSLPRLEDVSRSVTLLQPSTGGHVGFVSGSYPGKTEWLPDTLVGFFHAHLLPLSSAGCD